MKFDNRLAGWLAPLWLPARLFGFWLLFFAVFRIWFIVWFQQLWPPEAPRSPWAALWHALPLDLSMAAYLSVTPVLLWFAGLAAGPAYRPLAGRLILVYHVVVISILVLIFGANVFLYEEWNTLINNRALEYLRTPAALLDSMSWVFQLVSVGLFFLFVGLFFLLYRRVAGSSPYAGVGSRLHLAWLPLQLALLFLCIRGGLGVMPVNESAVYYSGSIFNNHAATNTSWHLIHSLVETRSTRNAYRYLETGRAQERVKSLLPQRPTPAADWLLRPKEAERPNIVLILMESMTAQVIEELGGDPGLCPELSRLIGESILFEQLYSSGFRTDQGLVSVLGGFPAQPDQSVILLEDKASKLPSLPKILDRAGYDLAFYYGGELTFANVGLWLNQQGFRRVVSEKDFPVKTQRWGADDRTMLTRMAGELGDLRPPFLAAALTLSLHPPFDVPYRSRWEGTDVPSKFRHSAAYADAALGEFFEAASRQPWYENTLFVLVADHGNMQPGGFSQEEPQARRVPLILAGPLIDPAWKGRRIQAVGNHHDIPATLLAALGRKEAAEFSWSRNLLPETVSAAEQGAAFGYYTNENGLGWVTASGKGFFRFPTRDWEIYDGSLDSTAREDAKAYLQVLYDEFLAL
jgi:phosphoglycerol transferase MdoB-like AlkP superfamily enzyme